MTDKKPRTVFARLVAPSSGDREQDDYYPTPPGATRALLSKEGFSASIYEPACGAGHMARVLEEYHTVRCADIQNRGYPDQELGDFLTCKSIFPGEDIVTNPPFKLATQFAQHAVALVAPHRGKVALFCRLMFMEGVRRKSFLEKHLTRVWVFSDRVPIQRGRLARSEDKGKMVPFAWFVFDTAIQNKHPTIGWVLFRDQYDPYGEAWRDDC